MEEVPSFYMYDSPELDHSWLRAACPGQLERMHETSAMDRLAEVGLYDLLVKHPQRVRDASTALLIIVPVWEWLSTMTGA